MAATGAYFGIASDSSFFGQRNLDMKSERILLVADDAARLVALLLRTLTESPAKPKVALATDLVAPPGLLAAPPEFLAENRRLIEAGGEIRRILISWAADLAAEPYSRDLRELVDSQRATGVQCGLVVRDHLRPEQAVDFLVTTTT